MGRGDIRDMKIYTVWLEGFSATGEIGRAQFCGEYGANDFAQACEIWIMQNGDFSLFNKHSLTYWGCRFFEDENKARATFG